MLRYDHYKLLGIARDATLAQIKRAYRERVKSCHPDINPSPRASAAFRAVHEAYSVLSDSRKRSNYDDQLRFYRKAGHQQEQTEHHPHKRYGHYRRQHTDRTENAITPAGPVDRFAFVGLHLTGLFFGLALVSGILVGITFHEWPVTTLLFSTFGIAVLPDSWAGIRTGARTPH